VHIGTPDEVIASLRADTTLARVTDITVQVHSVDPPHPFILRSLELVAEKVAPALGWQRGDGRWLVDVSRWFAGRRPAVRGGRLDAEFRPAILGPTLRR